MLNLLQLTSDLVDYFTGSVSFVKKNRLFREIITIQNSLLLEQNHMFEQYQLPVPQQDQQLYSKFQIQRNICSQYIKFATNQLHFKQAQVISTANQLLQKLSTKERVKDLSQWDVFSTRDSVILEDESSINLSTFSQQTKSKFIQRKSGIGSRNQKQTDQYLVDCIAEVEKQCTAKTVSTVKKVVEEYRRLKTRVFQLEKKQKTFKLKQKLIEDLQERTVILTRRIQDIQKDLTKSKADYLTLKAENSELMQQLHKKTSEMNSQKKIKLYEEIITHQNSGNNKSRGHYSCNTSRDILNDVISEKQNIINLRYGQVRTLQQKIQKQLFKEEDRCNKCCQILKKVKPSILSYKAYLQRQGEHFEQFIDKFKVKILDYSLTN